MKNYQIDIYDYVDKKTDQHIVKACTTFKGKSIYAVAKCDTADAFDIEFGTELATLKLEHKIALKRASKMKAYAKYCKTTLDYLEAEYARAKRALEHANSCYIGYKVEAEHYDSCIQEMLDEKYGQEEN
jgi:hypothetical protein